MNKRDKQLLLEWQKYIENVLQEQANATGHSGNLKIIALVVDSGRNHKVQPDCELIRRCIKDKCNVLEGLRSYLWHYTPFFVKAYFIIGEEYFVAENKPVYLSKNGEHRRKPSVGGTRIFETSLKPVKDWRMKLQISLDVARETD